MKPLLSSDERNYIYILKALAILAVVCAHSTGMPELTSNSNRASVCVLNYIGTMGVPVFYLIAGMLFEQSQKSFLEFFKKKLTTIVLPWLFCETLLWLYIVLRKGGVSIWSWLLFLLGYKHSTYYLTVLMVMFLVFWFIRKDIEIYLLIIISIISIISTGWHIGLNFVNELTGTFYLNPLNWFAFFGIGILTSRKKKLQELYNKTTNSLVILCILSVIYIVVCTVVFQENLYYFSRFSIIGHTINILLFGAVATKIAKCQASQIFILIGKYSFSIYLLHQFVIGIVVVLTNKLNFFILTLARPGITVFVVMLALFFLEYADKKTQGKLGKLKVLMGVRK